MITPALYQGFRDLAPYLKVLFQMTKTKIGTIRSKGTIEDIVEPGFKFVHSGAKSGYEFYQSGNRCVVYSPKEHRLVMSYRTTLKSDDSEAWKIVDSYWKEKMSRKAQDLL